MRRVLVKKARQSAHDHLCGVFAGEQQQILAVQAGLNVGAPQERGNVLLDEFRHAFLEQQHCALAGAERRYFLWYQRIDHVESEHRQAGVAEVLGQAQHPQCAQDVVVQASRTDDSHTLFAALEDFVQPVVADEFPGCGQAHVRLELLLPECGRRMREALVIEFGGTGEELAGGNRRRAVVAGDKAALEVAGADAQLHDDRTVGRLGEFESLFDHLDDHLQTGARIEQPHRRLERHGVGALQRHARARLEPCVEPATARDSKREMEQAQAEIVSGYSWLSIGPEGDHIQAVVNSAKSRRWACLPLSWLVWMGCRR